MKPPKHILLSNKRYIERPSSILVPFTINIGLEINECSNFGFHHRGGTIMKLKDDNCNLVTN